MNAVRSLPARGRRRRGLREPPSARRGGRRRHDDRRVNRPTLRRLRRDVPLHERVPSALELQLGDAVLVARGVFARRGTTGAEHRRRRVLRVIDPGGDVATAPDIPTAPSVRGVSGSVSSSSSGPPRVLPGVFAGYAERGGGVPGVDDGSGGPSVASFGRGGVVAGVVGDPGGTGESLGTTA